MDRRGFVASLGALRAAGASGLAGIQPPGPLPDAQHQYGIHVNLNFHRIPAYGINGRELEPADLFSGRAAERARALDAAVFHWKAFARRYQGISTAA